MPTTGEYSLYYHIPFCTKKCPYCHFFVLPDHEPSKDVLLKALCQEFVLKAPNGKLSSLYFGGGTPSLFGPERVAEVISWSKSEILPETEITLEVNPEGATKELIAAYKKAGVNRISLGVQSFDEGQLVQLGRTHSSSAAERAVWAIKEAGIDNISIDLMYDLPGQTLAEWERSLRKAASLPITHLSLYNLTIEPTSLFFKSKEKLEKGMPSPKLSQQMYELAQNILTEAGLIQYEISAFARPDFHSIHNTGYWLARPFYGLGPSAFSYLNGERFRNIAHLNKYASQLDNNTLPIDFSEKLLPDAHERELFTIHLRLLQGVPLPSFVSELIPLEKAGLVTLTPTHCRLTQKGILVYDSIAAELI